MAKHLGIKRKERSEKRPGFRAANGSEIKHHGQRIIKGITDQFAPMGITAQVADVQTTLGSVNQMLKAGNAVHFEPGRCYVQHLETGRTTPIEEKAGTYEIGVWVPRAAPKPPSKGEGERRTNQGFGRQEASAPQGSVSRSP